MKLEMAKNRIEELGFVRTICTVGIIVNHFTIAVNKYCVKIFDTFPNSTGSVGYSIVTVFFILSGILLYHHHSNLSGIPAFYKKRWRSIYPSYYVAYFPVFLILLLLKPGYFKKAKPLSFLLTLIGFDGYTSKAIDNYYTLVGDWFLGIIIILYLIFPLILKAIEKNYKLTLAVVIGFFIAFCDWRMLNQNEFRNVFSCIFSFLLGMIIDKLQIYNRKRVLLITVPILLFLCFSTMIDKINFNLLCHAVGICLFFVLFYVGKILKKSFLVRSVDSKISNVSYEMFLIQHVIIFFVCDYINIDSYWKFYSILIFLCIVIYFIAVLVKMISEHMVDGINTLIDRFFRYSNE